MTASQKRRGRPNRPSGTRRLGFSNLLPLLAVASASSLALVLEAYITVADIVMIFLLAIIATAFYTSVMHVIVAVLLAIATFDFLFVPPRHTFSVHDAHFVLTFGVMALVGMALALLSDRVRRQAEELASVGIERERERMQAALLSSVSHDLRTPLGVILSAATTLLDAQMTLNPHRSNELLQTIEHQSNNLARLLRNLLEMTRLDGGLRQEIFEPHPVEEVIETAVRGLAKDASERIGAIRTPPRPVFARVDPVAIEIALSNLLENAAKYSPDDSPIEIRVELDGLARAVVVEVEDRGPGVPVHERQRIFDKFVRGVHTSTHGAGLGLAIARAIVEAHGGYIYHRNVATGSGSIFGFTLPEADVVVVEEPIDA